VSDLVEAARFNYPYQADLFRIFLEQHGVEALVFDTGSAGYSDGAMVGVRVVVLDENLEEARRLFREYER
jgi:hypothetical protein